MNVGSLTPADRPALALAFSLAASVTFSGMGVFVTLLHGAVGTPETVFFRGLVGTTMGLVLHALLRVRPTVQAPFVLALRILTGTLSLTCYYGSIEGAAGNGPGELATASLLLKTAPVWVALGAGFILGESSSRRTWVALVVGVIGATIAIVGPEGPGGRGAVVLGLLSGIFAAGAYLAVRRLASSEEPLTVVTLFSLGVALITLPVVLWRRQPLPDARALGLLTGMSVCGTLAQWLMTHAYRHSKAAVVAVSGLAEVAFSTAASILFLGGKPSASSFVGGALAVFAGVVATWPRRAAPVITTTADAPR